MRPEAEITGVTVQKMIAYPNSLELILGTKKDPVFGPVIMVGMGGVAAEVFQDRALELPPLNDVLARRMLESLKSWPLLRGYRGKPGANVDRLIEIIMRFSYLVADYAEIKELDINPLLVTPEDMIALDARVVVDRRSRRWRPGGAGRTAHLAIRPYPEEYVTQRKLKDGTQSCCGRSSPRTSRSGTNCWPAARRSRGGSASTTCSSRRRTRWPRGTALSTTIANWRSWPRSRKKAGGSWSASAGW